MEFRPWLGSIGHNMLVVRAEEREVVFDQLLPLVLFSCNPDAAGADHADRLEILGAHDRADAACGVRKRNS